LCEGNVAFIDEPKFFDFDRFLIPIRVSSRIVGQVPEFLADGPGQPNNFEEIGSLKGRVLRVYLEYFIGGLPGEYDCAHVDEHGKAHSVDELVLFSVFGVGGLEGVEENRVPDVEGVVDAELPSVHAPDPSQQEGLGLHILKLDDSEKFEVGRFQALVLKCHNSLEDG
jgi:hypothetical protein